MTISTIVNKEVGIEPNYRNVLSAVATTNTRSDKMEAVFEKQKAAREQVASSVGFTKVKAFDWVTNAFIAAAAASLIAAPFTFGLSLAVLLGLVITILVIATLKVVIAPYLVNKGIQASDTINKNMNVGRAIYTGNAWAEQDSIPYAQGYEDAQLDAAEKAKNLRATQNKTPYQRDDEAAQLDAAAKAKSPKAAAGTTQKDAAKRGRAAAEEVETPGMFRRIGRGIGLAS